MKKLWVFVCALFNGTVLFVISFKKIVKSIYEIKDKRKKLSVVFFVVKILIVIYIYKLLLIDLDNMFGVANWFVKLFVNRTNFILSIITIILPQIMVKIFKDEDFEMKYMNKTLMIVYKYILDFLFSLPTLIWVVSFFNPSIYDQLGQVYDNIVKVFLTIVMCVVISIIVIIVIILVIIIANIIIEIIKVNKENKKKTIYENKKKINNDYVFKYENKKDYNNEKQYVIEGQNNNVSDVITEKPIIVARQKREYYDVPCENCDGHMVRRQNRDTDEYFYGCSNFKYGYCRFTLTQGQFYYRRKEK